MKTISSLKRFGKLTILVGGLVFAAQNSSAFCLWNCSAKKAKEQASKAEEQRATKAEELMVQNAARSSIEALKNEVNESFVLLEEYLAKNENKKAHELTIYLLKKVQTESGFNFHSSFGRDLFVSSGLDESYLDHYGSIESRRYDHFENLGSKAQRKIIKEVSNHGQGLLLDLINLTKRIVVFKARAALAMFEAEGPISDGNRNNILINLAYAKVSRIQVIDSSGHRMRIASKHIFAADDTYTADHDIELFVAKNLIANLSSDVFEKLENRIVADIGETAYDQCQAVIDPSSYSGGPRGMSTFAIKLRHGAERDNETLKRVCERIVAEEPTIAVRFETPQWRNCVSEDYHRRRSLGINSETLEQYLDNSVRACARN